MPDPRAGRNIQYSMGDIGMAAFSVFFMRHPSFLAFQRSLSQNAGNDNTRSPLAMSRIPTDNHIRQILDGMDPQFLDGAYFYLVDATAAQYPGIVNN